MLDKETISLVIKSPNQFHGDQLIEGVRADWTVKDLKCHLSKVYPNNPVGLDGFLIVQISVYMSVVVSIPQHTTQILHG